MATLTRGQNFAVTETVTNTKLHNLVDLASISGIVDADISPSAAIQFSKLLASSISGALLTNLNLISSGAGIIPSVNIPPVTLVSIPNQSLLPLTLASWVDGISLRNLCSTPADKQIRYNLLVSSIASGDVPAFDGANNFVGARSAKSQVFTADGTFTAPLGVTKVFVTMVGGGGAGGAYVGSNAGAGGGGGGAMVIKKAYTVTPGSAYAVSIGAAGAAADGTGGNGGQTSFDSAILAPGGSGGILSSGSQAGGAGGGTGFNGSSSTAGGYTIVGGNGGNGSTVSGGGGGTIFGAGGAGVSASNVGNPGGTNTGAGGSGGCGGGGTHQLGGAGGSGLVIVEW